MRVFWSLRDYRPIGILRHSDVYESNWNKYCNIPCENVPVA
jgi:hypothetical protein